MCVVVAIYTYICIIVYFDLKDSMFALYNEHSKCLLPTF